MDLPTCPSCGQSVLDDDAVDCPFCGAAMDGSSPAKTKKAAPAAKKKSAPPADGKTRPVKKSPPASDANEDPFAIAQTPAATKAIRCAPKPMKGRLHKVVCPMCDTPGFIPKAAVGRQVKCANKECLVPIFTATDSDGQKPAKAPARISDDEPEIRRKKKTTDKPANPMIKYAIGGAIALAATFGLLQFLNKPAPDQLGAYIPPAGTNSNTDFEDDDPDLDAPAGKQPEEAVEVAPQRSAVQLIATMIDTARVTAGNRDKPFCRQLTADAYLRMNMEAEAQAEFEQMHRVASSRGRQTQYYRTKPLVADYWSKLKAGDAAGATAALKEAQAAAEEIPSAVLLAQDTAVTLASAVMNSGDAETAQSLITGQQRDSTVATQQDQVKYGAWNSLALKLVHAGRSSLPPLQVFSWNEPLMTAVGVDLSIHGQWQAATDWASALPNEQTASDTFAAVADQMVQTNAPEAARAALATAAEAKGSDIALRTHSVLALADGSQAWFNKAAAGFTALPAARVASLGTIPEVINMRAPKLDAVRLRANSLADFVAAAHKNAAADQATAGLKRFTEEVLSTVPPTSEVRQAGGEIDRNDNAVEEKVKQALSLSNSNQVRSRFTAYRRSLDGLIRASEERRLMVMELLAQIVQSGGLPIVQTALQEDGGLLRQEVAVDSLSGLLLVAAATVGQEFPEALQNDAALAVPAARVARTDPLPEQELIPVLVQSWQQFQQTSDLKSAAILQSSRALPGLQSAMAERMAEQLAQSSTTPEQLFASVTQLKSDLWRERCVAVMSRILADRGYSKQVEQAIISGSLTPVQRILSWYGLTRSAIDSATASAEGTKAAGA